MLELAGGIAFGMNVGDFLELEGAFKCNGEARSPAEIKDVSAFCEIDRKPLDLRLERQSLDHQARHFDQRAHELMLVLLGQHATCATGFDRKAGEDCELTGECLARSHPDLGASQRRHHGIAFARNR